MILSTGGVTIPPDTTYLMPSSMVIETSVSSSGGEKIRNPEGKTQRERDGVYKFAMKNVTSEKEGDNGMK